MSSERPAAQAGVPHRVSWRCRSSGRPEAARRRPRSARCARRPARPSRHRATEVSSRAMPRAPRGRLRRRRAHGLRPGRAGTACSGGRAPTTWPSRSCASCSAATRPPARANRRRRLRRDRAGRRPGPDARPRRRAPRRPAATVPGFAVDRMCAGALTATTAGAGEIAMGAADVVLVGGVEHMGHHPMGAEVDFNPRFVAERSSTSPPPSWARRPRTCTTRSRS